MDEFRAGSYSPASKAIFEDQKNADKLIKAAAEYVPDSLRKIRLKAYDLIRIISQASEDQNVRIQATGLLCRALGDEDSGVIASALRGLKGYNQQDFGDEGKLLITQSIQPNQPHVDRVAKLAGFIGISNATEPLNQLINSNIPYKNKWAAHIALARLGDQTSIDYLTQKLASAPIGDSFMYDVVPDLVYTRQPEIFKFLEDIIFSDEADCNSSNPDSDQKILCGYRVMEMIGNAIIDFPLPLNKYGEPMVKDYEQALIELRAWFENNPDYEMKKYIY